MTYGTLSTTLQDGVTRSLSSFKLFAKNVDFYSGWGKLETDFLNWCLEKKLIDELFLKQVVHRRLLLLGKEMGRKATGRDADYADYVDSPQALAYAIKYHAFTIAELGGIKFDHGATPGTFMTGQVDTLDEEVLKQLLAGPPDAPAYINTTITWKVGGTYPPN